MIKYFGDLNYRGLCPKEAAEHMTFVSHVNNNYPDLPLVHVKNEGADLSGANLRGATGLDLMKGEPRNFDKTIRGDIVEYERDTWWGG